uniref:Outer dense fiber protein 3 n=1 Tax=Anopheles atroparvus TaxID=41427 RepID=A0A182J669_ANOAO
MQGPGPAKYKLPSTFGFNEHDPRKERKPMYTMRALPKYNRGGTIGPGPAGYALEKLTRTGKPHDRMYSMGARLQMPKQDLTPGPGAHDNHRVPTMKCNRAPMYSFGKRLDLSNKDIVPGPNRYDGVVHMCRPKAPAYSISPIGLLKARNERYMLRIDSFNRVRQNERKKTSSVTGESRMRTIRWGPVHVCTYIIHYPGLRVVGSTSVTANLAPKPRPDPILYPERAKHAEPPVHIRTRRSARLTTSLITSRPASQPASQPAWP